MKTKVIYTKFALKSFKIISFCCAILLLFSISHKIIIDRLPLIQTSEKLSLYNLFYIIYNIIVFLLCIFLFFFPQKFGITSLIAFIYAFTNIPFEQENYMGIMMYFLGVALLFVRGLMKKHTKVKLIIRTVLLTKKKNLILLLITA